VAVISILIFGYSILMNNAFWGWNGKLVKGEEVLKTELNDEFVINYETRRFAEYETFVLALQVHSNITFQELKSIYDEL
jgi:hypothetical protein